MSVVAVHHFLRRAKDFEYSMKLCNESNLTAKVEFPATGMSRSNKSLQSAALLGIHAAISYADALRAALGDETLSAEDHQKAVSRLRRVLVERKVKDLSGVNRFSSLIGKKSIVAYGKGRVTENDMKLVVEASQRFSSWINLIGRKLNVEGWGNVGTEE